MNKCKRKTIIKLILACALGIVTVGVIFITHRLVPFMLDDFWYSTCLSSEDKLSSFKDVIDAQIWHYNNWGGRSMTHGFLQLMLMRGELFCDIMNTLVTVVLAIMIFITAREIAGDKLSTAGTVCSVSLIMGALHGLNANWEMSMYWQSGSANYLYSAVILVLYSYCYIREITDAPRKPLKGIAIWIVPVAILAGWSNENMGPSVCLVSLAVIYYVHKKHLPLRAWHFEGVIFSFLGSAACILAPGNMVRSNDIEKKSFIWESGLRVYSEIRGLVDYLFPILVVTFILFFVWFPVLKNRVDLKIVAVTLIAILGWGAMVLSPHYPDRATFGSLVFLIIASAALIFKLRRQNEAYKPWLFILSLLIWLRGLFYLLEYIGMSKYWIV